MENERVRVSLTVREELLQKMIHKDLGDTDDDQKVQGIDGTQEAMTKPKKKKNKKKKNKGAKKEGENLNNPEIQTNNDKTVENCKENENIQPKGGKKKDYLSIKFLCFIN